MDSLFSQEDIKKASKYLKRAVKIGEETDNINAMILSNHFLGHAFIDNCEFEKGYQHINTALQIVEGLNIPWGIAIHKSCLALNIYYNSGKIDLAYRTSLEGLQMAEESGDILSKLEAYGNHGICAFGKGLFGEAEEYLSRHLEISSGNNIFTVQSNFHLGIIFHQKGEYHKAIQCYKNALSWEGSGSIYASVVNTIKILLARAKVMIKDKNFDLSALCKIPSELKIRRYEGKTKRSLGDLLLNFGDDHLSQAEQWITQAMEADKKNGMKFELGLDNLSYAELFKRKGDMLIATETLGRALQIFKDCGADGWVEKYEKELAAIS
jgi:tetratricopeptide (TPR) repeat protein